MNGKNLDFSELVYKTKKHGSMIAELYMKFCTNWKQF